MPRQLSLPVVGAPYDNKDGSNRRFEIMLCSPGEPIDLVPEPRNKFDEHAVKVVSCRGVQIGYIESERAVHIGMMMRAGNQLSAIFQAATEWGALVRVGVDEEPVLPTPRDQADADDPDDSGFYPDWIPPDE